MSGASDRTPAERVRNAAAGTMTDVLAELQQASSLCTVALFIDGYLDGITDYLVTKVGPEKAYGRLQKSCDALARRVADQRVAQQGS